MYYNNALTSITSFATPDPFLVQAHGRYYLTYTCGNRIELLKADTLIGLRNATPTTIWRPPLDTCHSGGLWAPELHALDGRWYIYYAAEHPALGNKSHRMYVLGGPPADHDPTNGPWEFCGTILGMPEEQWAIDGTVFELKGQRYFCYSGWPRGELNRDLNQELFIIKLDNPTQAGSQPVKISGPEEAWERTRDDNGDHGINEGPQWLAAPSGAWCGIVYSCAGSWTCDYKMAVLRFLGGDPLDPQSWRKDTRPLLQSSHDGDGPFGPGHGSFAYLNDVVLGVFHATNRNSDGWANRRARAQRVVFNSHGPFMGGWVGPETDSLEDVLR